jgi:hypothetical protein
MPPVDRRIINAQYNATTEGAEYDSVLSGLSDYQIAEAVSRNEAVKAVLRLGLQMWQQGGVVRDVSSAEFAALQTEVKALHAELAALGEIKAWLLQIGQAVIHDLPAQIAALPTLAGRETVSQIEIPAEQDVTPTLKGNLIQGGMTNAERVALTANLLDVDW